MNRRDFLTGALAVPAAAAIAGPAASSALVAIPPGHMMSAAAIFNARFYTQLLGDTRWVEITDLFLQNRPPTDVAVDDAARAC